MMNPNKFQRFHNDLKAAIVARVPIEFSDGATYSKTWKQRLAELNHLECDLQSQLESETPIEDVLSSHSEIPRRYQAALIAFDRLDSMVPILDALMVRQLATAKVAGMLRKTVFYLMLVMLIAFLGLWFYNDQIVPAIQSMRADLLLMASVRPSERIDPLPWLPTIVVMLGVCVVMVSIWLLVGGAQRIAGWLGGRKFVRCEVTSSAIRLVQLLQSTGLESTEAVSVSCDLTGADSVTRGEIRASATDRKSGVANHLQALADYFSMLASRRFASMKVVAPVVLISTLGGSVAAIYGILIFWPIISMLKDLATAGI